MARYEDIKCTFPQRLLSDESWVVFLERQRSQSKYFTGRLGRSEGLYLWKRDSFCGLKMHTFKKNWRRAYRGEIISHFPRRALRGTAWSLHYKFASYAYCTDSYSCGIIAQLYELPVWLTKHSGAIHTLPTWRTREEKTCFKIIYKQKLLWYLASWYWL